MKTLNLSILDRLMLQQILPVQGGKIEMLLTDAIAKKVEFALAEIAEFKLKDDGGGVSWDAACARDTEYGFTAEQVEILKSAAKRADDEKKITRQTLGLIEKIDSI